MEQWASSETFRRDPSVQFLCVCVESKRVAQEFDGMFNFQHAINAYIPSSQYLPRGYGQLGCSGFIIVDVDGKFISKRTTAYLDHGETAFRHVEVIICNKLRERLLLGSSSARLRSNGEEKKTAKETKASTTTSVTPTKVSTPPSPTASTTTPSAAFPSLGIASVDSEHEECEAALKNLIHNPIEGNLRKVVKVLQVHFVHEETLMVKHGFGGSRDDRFSAISSHVQDHKRIIQQGLDALKRIEQAAPSPAEAEGKSCCNMNNSCGPAPNQVDRLVATQIMESFQRHTTNFDALYVSHIPSNA